jgi:serine/threonine protein kinase
MLMTSASTAAQHEMARAREVGEENFQKRDSRNENLSNGGATSTDPTGASASNRVQYGAPIPVETTGKFPEAGSTLGPYFCLGTLGKGTFSSIHKCINLDYAHHSPSSQTNNCRLAAAKVELSTFANSGVLLGEALVLHFLDEALPRGTVPVYMGHYTAGDAAAIVMEYLPGEDMHQLRENRNAQSPIGKAPRRLTIDDAVYLTADVMLPLLEKMHKVGIVHRDVKPSNCVRSQDKQFCLVDFGLSKSIVVPMDSGYADLDHPWPKGQPWLIPPSDNAKDAKLQTQPGCVRKERQAADFRGTSMYASPRVHQGRDYCPRDDVWSLLYVFCDLVSGGLPWMSHAANRDRDTCQKIKERIHGLSPGNGKVHKDETEQLLMGDEYHVAMFKQQQKDPLAGTPASKTPLPPGFPKALDMSKDKVKIQLLRRAFQHVANLHFWDTPDYALIQRCIRGFLDEEGAVGEPDDIEIDWSEATESEKKSKFSPTQKDKEQEDDLPKWGFWADVDGGEDRAMDEDPMVNTDLFKDVPVPPPPTEPATGLPSTNSAVQRLPIEMQFRIAQMEYHAKSPKTVPPHLVLRDWMKVAIPLLYQDWDAKAYEKGGHRTSTDGYRRELYLELVEKCSKWARLFHNFSQKEYLGYYPSNGEDDEEDGEEGEVQPHKRRRIVSTFSGPSPSDLVAVSKMLFGLQAASRSERAKSFAPPPLLSFGPAR